MRLAQKLFENSFLLKDWGISLKDCNWFPLNEDEDAPLYCECYSDVSPCLVIVSETLSSVNILNDIVIKAKQLPKGNIGEPSCLLWVEHFDASQFSNEITLEQTGNRRMLIKQKDSVHTINIYFNMQEL